MYGTLNPDEAQNSTTVKARRYNIDDETYWQRFRGLKYKPGQTPAELATYLTDLAAKTSADEVKGVMAKKQVMAALPEDFWVLVT